VSRGRVTKQGSRLLRWALIEAIQRAPADSAAGAAKAAIIARRGKEARNIARVAAARRLLTLVFYGMRDGQIRCLLRVSGQSVRPSAACGMSSSSWPAARREVASCACPAAVTRPGAGALLTDPA
jgi:hypothetical protein